MTIETTIDISDALYPDKEIYSNLVYLMDKDADELVKKYHAVRAEKHIVSSYSIGSRHVLVLFINGKVKKIIKKNRRK